MTSIGNPNAIISQQAVRRALDNLVYSSGRRIPSPLTKLTLIEEFLSDPVMPRCPEEREFALNYFLVECIRDQFTLQRRAFGLLPPDTYTTQQEALEDIVVAARVGSPDLLGWGWLYYHYVRVDLHITPPVFCQSAHVDPRSLRRYQQHTLARLTMHLIERERMARTAQHQRRLLTVLPVMTPIALFGRHTEIGQVQRLLSERPPHHLQVVGQAGIGKTTFVQEMVRWQVMTECVDEIIWIDTPSSVGELQRILENAFPHTSLRDFTVRFRLVVVLDTIELLRWDVAGLQHLLHDLSLAVVYLINPTPLPLTDIRLHLYLHPLDRETVFAFVRSLKGEFVADDLDAIFSQVGGNPRALKEHLFMLEQHRQDEFASVEGAHLQTI